MIFSDKLDECREFIRGLSELNASKGDIGALVRDISSIIKRSFTCFRDSDTKDMLNDSSPVVADIHLKLNPVLSFYNMWFRPSDKDANAKRPEGIDFEQAFIEAYFNRECAQEPIAIDEELETRLSGLARDYFGKNDMDNPFACLLTHQIMKHFREKKLFGPDSYNHEKVRCYLDIIETKLYVCFKRRNIQMLESIIRNCSYGMPASKRRADMDSIGRGFISEIGDIINYIIELPDAINRYYGRNKSAFAKELCLNKSSRDYFIDVRELVHALEGADSACSHSRYDKEKIHANILNANKKSVIKKGFYDNLRRLIHSEECEDENELVEVASLDVPNYLGLRKLGRGAIKTAFLARNKNSNDEVVLLSIDPNSKGYKHYETVYPGLSATQTEKKILDAEFSVTKLLKLTDSKYIAVMVPPIKGEVKGEEHFFMQTSKIYEKTIENAIEKGEITPEKAVKYFYQLCYALNNCHKEGIVHKDLKPDNMGIAADDNLLLSDFGCTSMFSQGADCRYQYPLKLRPPELAHGHSYWEEVVGLQSDLFTPEANTWTAGAIFYRMLMGEDIIKMEGQRAEIGTDEYHRQNEEAYKKIQAFGENERDEKVAEVREKYKGNHGNEYAQMLELCLQTDRYKRKGGLERCKDICNDIIAKDFLKMHPGD